MPSQALQPMSDSFESSRPRLAPAVSVVQDGADTCYLMMTGKELLRCHGPLVPTLMTRLLPLLDGTRSVAEIREALEGTLEAERVEEVLRLLLRHHLLLDAGPEQELSTQERAAFGSLLALLARSTPQPYRVLERLRRMRLVVVGDSELAREVVEALAECAVGAIDLVSPREAWAELKLELPVRLRHVDPGQLQNIVPGAELVIGVQDGEFNFTRQMRELNRLCLRLGVSWLQVRLTLEAEGWLGPLHTPDTACFECMDLRMKSNLRTWREHGLHEEQVEQGLLMGRRIGFRPLQRQLAGALAVEVLLHLTGLETSRLVGRSLVMDALSQESSLHPVLKHPGCPACGRPPEARLHPWGEEDIRLDRTLLPDSAAAP
ncbi:MAG TPA: TOMM precursor leader peptide-binding protein [Archangium sp.]|uniref:TOMM precursor leader peptide-binding protein n=1 Tax=Archangium sp. TaxID=1872627 RepID=UPI002E36A560|nr:TOMM precursor leader peptide-binding protein [Archangium sp.]HEX5751300.1 TOMM precursor leader peptide-binding protein [Archangium sp.]